MHVSALKQSKFLTRHDVGKGILVTIKGDVYQENVAKEGAPEELRWCLDFDEVEKPFVLNSTNGQLIAQITGSEDSERWNGHKIVLYDDPSVSFGGKLVGGIRVRAPRGAAARPVPSGIKSTQPPPAAKPPPPPQDQDMEAGGPEDDTPF